MFLPFSVLDSPRVSKISEGTGFRIHMIHKAAVAAKKFGPKSSKKFGEGFMPEI